MKTILCLLLGIFLVTTVFAEEVTTQRCVALNRIDLDDDEILNKKNVSKKCKSHKLGVKTNGAKRDEFTCLCDLPLIFFPSPESGHYNLGLTLCKDEA